MVLQYCIDRACDYILFQFLIMKHDDLAGSLLQAWRPVLRTWNVRFIPSRSRASSAL